MRLLVITGRRTPLFIALKSLAGVTPTVSRLNSRFKSFLSPMNQVRSEIGIASDGDRLHAPCGADPPRRSSPRTPCLQKIPTLGPKVYKYDLNLAIWSPRAHWSIGPWLCHLPKERGGQLCCRPCEGPVPLRVKSVCWSPSHPNHMGGCQNYGPFLRTPNIRCRIIIGIQKGMNF